VTRGDVKSACRRQAGLLRDTVKGEKRVIESYGFGRIVIDGQTYTSDVIVFPDRVQANWWREQGHSLSIKDLAPVFAYGPEILVIGTGHNGMMRVPEATTREIESRNISVRCFKTGEAVVSFNALSGSAKVAGAFHLTC